MIFKTFLKLIVVYIFLAVAGYLLGSFYESTFDSSLWCSPNTKINVISLIVGGSVIATMATFVWMMINGDLD